MYHLYGYTHPYNTWQLHTIHANRHGYMRLLLGSVIFHQAMDTIAMFQNITAIQDLFEA